MSYTPQQQRVLDLSNQGMSPQAVADELGISRRTVRGHLDRIKAKGIDPAIQQVMDRFGTDLVPKSVYLKDKHHTVQLTPRQLEEKSFMDKVVEAFHNIPEAPEIIRETEQVLTENMTVYPMFDVHLGMLAHAEVSGEDMDLEKGVKRVKTAMSKAMGKAPDSYRGIIINGGDFTHQTNNTNKTPRSGHTLDVAARNGQTVWEAVEVIAACIEMALKKHEIVEYYSVPGNHDPQNWETIMVGLHNRYHSNPRVNIDVRWKEFSVIEHGEIAIFIHHGDKRTPKDLAMYCAAEFPEVWGRTRYRIVMTGHLHHIKVDEFPGIYWMQVPALAVRDHHAAGGYKSHSLLYAMTFDRVSETDRDIVLL